MKPGDMVWTLCLAAVAALLLIPVTREGFVRATGALPYPMGFAKFAVLATMGELLSIRITTRAWQKPKGMIAKAFVWGIIGLLVVLMFSVFSNGVAGATANRLLPVANGFPGKLLRAFFTSSIMNLTFAPAFMACHRISDTWIEMHADGQRPGFDEVLRRIDWHNFVHLVLFRTIPGFWIPLHTATFLLPPEYRVLVAALLSIALGLILPLARRRSQEAT